MENFSAHSMAKAYLRYYEKVANGETLHEGPIHFEPEANPPKFLPLG
jgi:hypothetical protein